MSLLELQNITKKFGGLSAVTNVSFSIPDTGIVGLIGPNGAGKTTIFNLITGVYTVSSGKILFKNSPIHHLQPYKIASMGITRTFQNIRLFKKLTTFENIVTACHAEADYPLYESVLCGFLPHLLHKYTRYYKAEQKIKKQAEKLLEFMGLSDRKNMIAHQLPYGLQRRLEIARALALKPHLLLLDEPGAGMNPDESEKLTLLIQKIKEEFKLSIILIEHHMDIIMAACESIVVLNFGNLIANGTPLQIQSDPLVKEAYLGVA